jgi:aldehyde dehydrogenase (NAD+)
MTRSGRMAVGRRIRASTAGHNAFKNDFSIAFGGFKRSDIGREGGVEGLRPFLESKTMIFERLPEVVEADFAASTPSR